MTFICFMTSMAMFRKRTWIMHTDAEGRICTVLPAAGISAEKRITLNCFRRRSLEKQKGGTVATPDRMMLKRKHRALPIFLAVTVCMTAMPVTAWADSSKVVTLGADLTDEQKEEMYEYFGTSADDVVTIEVTNADEREYMEGIASEEQIGTRTYSCSYVEPTSDGGIQVKTANLTYVTSSMISSTLFTAGVENCNVVAASPIAVSGTGALTGIMMAYETASGETLDDDQKETAMQELVITGELADDYGDDSASELINDVKEQVIEGEITDPEEIEEAVSDAAGTYNITLTEDQMDAITSLMESISQYDYDVSALKETLDNLDEDSGGFFSRIWGKIVSFFTGDSSDGGIINDTQDDVLGEDVVTDSTLDSADSGSSESEDDMGLWERIVSFFRNLFSSEGDSGASGSADSEDSAESAEVPAETDTGTDNTITEESTVDSSAGDEEENGSDSDLSGTAAEEGTDTDAGDADTSDSVSGTEEDSGSVVSEEEAGASSGM